MENNLVKLIKELAKESSEKREGAKEALDIVLGYLIIAAQLDDEIEVQEVKNFISNNCTEITTREDFQRYYRLMKEKFIESKFSPTSEKMKP